MSSEEIFDSCVRSTGDLAGVFEYDGETCYFYLYEPEQGGSGKVIGSIHVLTGVPDFADADVSIRWDIKEQKVGLFIRDRIWAVFDSAQGLKFGGGYRAGARPLLPPEATVGFGVV